MDESLVAWTLFIFWCAAITGIGVAWAISKVLEWKVRRAEKRLAQAEAILAAETERLERTQRFFATWNLTVAPEPDLVKLCCKKAEPCERHVER
ncbi:MAG TPA: hypothetical protein VHG72_21760 [Polyangia bacterium]|nr:hypothetical protein [Polyangia bacterium]